MQCPYCNNEMKKGTIIGDGRTKAKWVLDGDKIGLGGFFAGKGLISAASYSLAQFKICSYFCEDCKKMIFDTDVQR